MSYFQINLFILAAGMIALFVGVLLSREPGQSLKGTVFYGLGWSCFIGMFDATITFMDL